MDFSEESHPEEGELALSQDEEENATPRHAQVPLGVGRELKKKSGFVSDESSDAESSDVLQTSSLTMQDNKASPPAKRARIETTYEPERSEGDHLELEKAVMSEEEMIVNTEEIDEDINDNDDGDNEDDNEDDTDEDDDDDDDEFDIDEDGQSEFGEPVYGSEEKGSESNAQEEDDEMGVEEDLLDEAHCLLDEPFQHRGSSADETSRSCGMDGDDEGTDAGGSALKGEDDYIELTKTVVIEKGGELFDHLPEGWIEVKHDCGMPIYLHRALRVCTLARPYSIGPASVRKHGIPVNAVPCLHYKRELEKEEEIKEDKGEDGSKLNIPDSTLTATVSLKEAEDVFVQKTLASDDLQEYCRKLFQFKSVAFRKYNTWRGRKRAVVDAKNKKKVAATVVTFTSEDIPEDQGFLQKKHPLHLNPMNKTFLAILHEYLQWALGRSPDYTVTESLRGNLPYECKLMINGADYATGYGRVKKQAKDNAARETLKILVPKVYPQIAEVAKVVDGPKCTFTDGAAKYFDDIRVEDSRVPELCAKAGLMLPNAMLKECIRRQVGMKGDMPEMTIGPAGTGRMQTYSMVCAPHSATIEARSKKNAMQTLSQILLKEIHPHMTYYGSLLRKYTRSTLTLGKTEEEKALAELHKTKRDPYSTQFPMIDMLRENLHKIYRPDQTTRAVPKFNLGDTPLQINPISVVNL